MLNHYTKIFLSAEAIAKAKYGILWKKFYPTEIKKALRRHLRWYS